MKYLSLGSDSNLMYVISVGLFTVIVCFTALMAYKSYRMIQHAKPEVEPTTYWGVFKNKALGTGPDAIAMMMLWSILAIISIWATAAILFNEGFTHVNYDRVHVGLLYRLRSDPINIPWKEIKDIQLIQRTNHNFKKNWRIRITVLGGDTYESITCSKMTGQSYTLMNEAAHELQEHWKSNRQ